MCVDVCVCRGMCKCVMCMCTSMCGTCVRKEGGVGDLNDEPRRVLTSLQDTLQLMHFVHSTHLHTPLLDEEVWPTMQVLWNHRSQDAHCVT